VQVLRGRGCRLALITDSLATARAIAATGHALEVMIEVDTDGHRAGVTPESELLIEIGRMLHEGGAVLAGVMTHVGASCELEHARGAGGHGRTGMLALRARRRTPARRRPALPRGQRRLDAHRAVGPPPWRDGRADASIEQRFPVGTRLRILPNHACATAAPFEHFAVIGRDGGLRDRARFSGG